MGILARIIPAGARSDPNRAIGLLCAGIAVLCGTAHAQVSTPNSAEPEPDQPVAVERPSGANRLVRLFDFEESDFNPLPIPFGWVRAQNDPAVPRERPGFPIWNQASLDTTGPSVSGTGSVRLPVEGGSTSLRLLPGSIGVFPGADYMVDAWVRTEGVVHARACLTARLLDEQGEPLGGTRAVSAKVRTSGDWKRISAIVPGIDEQAAYLQIELLALQPEQQLTEFGSDARRERPFHVWREDYRGTVWFDDVAVTLLPRIELDTGVPGQAFRADETPSIDVLVRDLTGERLSGTLRVFDSDGALVDTQAMRSSSGKLGDTLTPSLPGPGWYRALLDVVSDGAIVGRGEVNLVWGASEEDETLATDAGRTTDRAGMFGISADAWTPPAAAALPRLAEWTGASRASVGVWHRDQTLESSQPGSNPAFEAVRGVVDLGVDTTIRLGEAPGDLADLSGRDPWDISGVLSGSEDLWMPWIEQALDQFGQGVISWQIGDEPTFAEPGTLAAHLDAADSVISRWVPGPELRTPGSPFDPIRLHQSRPGRGLVLRDAAGGDDNAPARMIRAWSDSIGASSLTGDVSRAPATITIEFEPASGGRADRAHLARAARRVIGAWFAAHDAGIPDRTTLALRNPWRMTADRRPQAMAVPELAMWRTLNGVLGPMTRVRSIDLIPGVRTLVADDGTAGSGVLIAWLDDPAAPSRTLSIPLSSGDATRVGLLGARTALPLVPGHRSDMSLHEVALSREPVLVTGVDTRYIETLASVRLSPWTLEPRIGQRRHELVLENPYDAPIQGKAFLVEPGGYSKGIDGRDRTWSIEPRVIPMVVPGRGIGRFPIDLSFGASQQSGWLAALIDVEFADRDTMPAARLTRWLRIDSPEFDLAITAYRRGPDIVVHAFVTNRSGEPRSADLAAFVPGSARERSSIPGVLPGATAHRRYVFRDAQPGVGVSVALTEPAGDTRLLERVELP